jgi:serine/threonine protein kinase/Tol biopolymer transport system component
VHTNNCAALPTIGDTLSHYQILDELGCGGMGVVFRAHDQQLARDVAIKVLRPELLADSLGMTRFRREARALAALNHPNIAAIFGYEECASSAALVMELVEGPTLADIIARQGALPLEEASSIGLQIASALECAHDHGIIHRDLKPGNIKVKEDASVKVLDFGLAQFLLPETDAGNLAQPSTASSAASKSGVVLGTLAYMSPEQARGEKVDRRTDIWAFGVVLFEMLTGRRAFQRSTSSDSIAAIIKEDPDWSALPRNVPESILHLLRRCLAKDSHDRLHSIADVRLEIAEILKAPPQLKVVQDLPAPTRAPISSLLWIAALLVALTLAAVRWMPQPPTAAHRRSQRFSILLPKDAPLAPASAMPLAVGRSSIVLSPDGSRLAYVGFTNGVTGLHLRDMERGGYRALDGTEGAHSPFFSPDGQWVGFFSHDKLKKVSVNGEPPITLCDAILGFGASWAADGSIYFATDYSSGLYRVSESGGASTRITDDGWKFVPSMFPQVIAGHHSILFSVQTFDVGVFDLRTHQGSLLFRGGTFPRFSPSGHILFAQRGSIQVAGFDAEQLKMTTPPIPLIDGVRTERDGAGQFTFSDDGTLVYASGSDGAVGSLVAIDRSGNKHPLQSAAGDYDAFRISPDGTHIAIPVNSRTGTDIWLYDISLGTSTRLTTDNASSFPIWSADGTAIYYCNWAGGTPGIFRKTIQTGETVKVAGGKRWSAPLAITRDGKSLLVGELNADTGDDLYLLHLGESGLAQETPFLASKFSECLANLSPNEHWIAYTSDESGGWEVYGLHPKSETRN